VAARVNRMQKAVAVLQQGLGGQPVLMDEETAQRVIKQAARIGIGLASSRQIEESGRKLKEGAIPMLKVRMKSVNRAVSLYDLHTQCVKLEDEEND
jgi:hypothetical protein